MKMNSFLIMISVVVSCSSPSSTKKQVSIGDMNTTTDTILQGAREIPSYVITDTLKVYAKFKINVYSFDSILANITFYNEENKPIYLYKPILPSDSLAENTFSVLGKDNKNLQHIAPLTNHKYFFGNQRFMPAIIPEDPLDKNLIEFKPGEQLNFRINIAKYYNFRQTDRKLKSKEVSIAYGNLVPYIIEGKQLYLPYTEPGLKGKRPVYFVVESKDDSRKYERINILLPLK